MNDCFGLRRLFQRKPSNGENMGNGVSRLTSSNNFVVVPTSDEASRVRRELKDPEGPGPITVKWIDYCFVKNGKKHRTIQYSLMNQFNPTLVVRRGFPIHLFMKFDRKFDINVDSISFLFKATESLDANFGNRTLVAVPLKENPNNADGQWSAYLINPNVEGGENVISVRVTPPSNCIVGMWQFEVDTRAGTEVALFSAAANPIYILFNAWCPTDEVYLKDEDQRNEYVLNESGLMWRGTSNRQKVVPWEYGQFQKYVLECAFILLTKIQHIGVIYMGDPVRVARTLSAVINAPDDMGLLYGNWTENFSGGTPPINWLGSVEILDKFLHTQKPVKYAQCWVYAGVVTTICRALGIPCRPVTAYCAAHDTQNSLTIDYMVDENGKIMDELQIDSIWNYHVWNEVWMARPDINVLDRNWQVIDATPQELSEGQYKCGPASVAAVKNGDVRIPYDTAFVFSEVNADKVYWRYFGLAQPLKLLRKDTDTIGKLICTKAVGKWDPEIITKNYKFPESSAEERSTMHKALQQNNSIFSRYYLNEDFNEIKFDFELNDDIIVGQNFKVSVNITNKGHKDYVVNVILRVDTADYTGKNGANITSVEEQRKVICDPGLNVQSVHAILTYEDYGKHVRSQNVFNVSVLASVLDTDYEYFGQDDFRVRKPGIKFEVTDKPVLMKEGRAVLKLTNPLPVPLRNGKFFVAGSVMPKTLEIKVSKIGAKKTVQVPFKFTPNFTGKQVISAKFTSKELQDVDGYLELMV